MPPSRSTAPGATRKEQAADLSGQIELGVRKAVRWAIDTLDDRNARPQHKLQAARFFAAPMARIFAEADATPDDAEFRSRFLRLLKEAREVPNPETPLAPIDPEPPVEIETDFDDVAASY